MSNAIDDPALLTDEFTPRLAQRYRPGVWIGGLRKAFGPVSEIEAGEDGAVESHPPHFLAALWRPPHLGMPLLPRWPFKVSIVAPDAAAALRDLLVDVPFTDRLWLTEQHIDWSLVARIVMLSEPDLLPFQTQGLQHMISAEEQTTFAAIRLHYGAGEAPLGLPDHTQQDRLE
jgi:hypothetical protein